LLPSTCKSLEHFIAYKEGKSTFLEGSKVDPGCLEGLIVAHSLDRLPLSRAS
jgi:hypothetical protein